MSKLDNLGEKTINKIAEMAFKSQVLDAKQLNVNVKIDRKSLKKGILESIIIDGHGLVMRRGLSLERMNISLNEIGVNPLKALMGDVQLVKPSQGKACIVLSEKDIDTALNLTYLNEITPHYDISVNNNPVRVNFEKITCRILGEEKVRVEAKLYMKETQSLETICLVFKPVVCNSGEGIFLEDLECIQGEELCPILVDALTAQIFCIFNLNHFVIDGISLSVNNLDYQDGKITLSALAGITHFPRKTNDSSELI